MLKWPGQVAVLGPGASGRTPPLSKRQLENEKQPLCEVAVGKDKGK